jgi:small subunit ribosomal protein S3Ae
MAKARSRTAARKIKDRWRAKNWYNVLAPPSFDNVTIADTLTDNPESLINRVTGVSLQDLTNDFRKSHITIFFKVSKVEETNAHTQFSGHSLTSDYLRRMIRRRRSKIEGVYDVTTRDGAVLRVKPFATTDKRIQNSQRKVVREAMKKTITDSAKTNTLSEFVKDILDGRVGSDIYKNCKKLYPVKRVEIYKTEVISQPTIMIEDKKPKKREEKPVEEKIEPEKKEKKTKKEEKKTEEIKEPKKKEDVKEKATKKEETKKAAPKKKVEKPAKKAVKKETKPTAKKATKKTTKAKTTTKKKTTTAKKKHTKK